MLGPDALLDLAADALRLPGTEGVEVGLTRSDSALTRFAGSRIHQSTSRLDGEARVRVVLPGGRSGVVATNDLTREGVRAAASRASEAAALLPPDDRFPGLTLPGQDYATGPGADDETAGCSAGRRAELVAQALASLPPGVEAAGTLETAVHERAVVNSLGVAVHDAATSAGATVLASGEDSSGWAEDGARAVSALDLAELGRRAGDKVLAGRHPREVPPGRYPVVLESLAVADLVQWLGLLALPGKSWNEGRSALTGRLGSLVCSPAVTIVDDPLSERLPGSPFDAEGTPTRRLPMIHAGVALAVAHDRATAAVAGTSSTGHALPPPSPVGGLPQHLTMLAGGSPPEELLAGLERGLYVTRFHYTNVVHPVQTTITGMTRDGTFLVEDGRVVGGVRNLRFTESVLDALSGVVAVGSDLGVTAGSYLGWSSAPSLRLEGFTFTSTTAY